jgi:hypothetical protein
MNKRAEQIRHIEQWRASGLSQSEYSRRQGLKMATFNYWVRHREVKAEKSLSSQLGAELLPVRIKEPAQPTAPDVHALVLMTTHGYRLELPASVSSRWLAELLQCLG